ncbi:inositol 2-dehydrogenase [Pseudoxanthomonas sangjuensis]|uniref:inositol 2-dehydrogenase n=1 Tax=Pseudoxanthomonas sangjuensis TaxID=1503750 RepID=UPI001391F0E9|nr:inositol 2-dehydrogenase [Pseudoxanthomonas sangjuensis]KAF1715058.1 inositol 2-dehydrogenase [Pseudoxanthomonas sangjuensis]
MHKIVLIGAGRIGRIHGRNAAANPRVELAGVVDVVDAAAQALAKEHGVPVRTLDDALADESVAGVIVASSTDTHLDYSLRAAAAGKAVFCEKPIDQDLTRAKSAAKELARARLLLAFNRRFDPNFQALKAKLDSGAVGRLESLQITSNDPAPPPPSYVAVSGGLFKDMAIHDFDMARWLLGEEPVEVYASGSCLVDPEIGKLGDVDTARTVLKTTGGRLCVISNSRRSGFGYDQRIEAYASAGMVRADNVLESTVQAWNENGAAADKFQNFFLDRYAEAYRREMEHFADILDGAAPSVGYADGVAALALAEAAAESSRSGKVVRL